MNRETLNDLPRLLDIERQALQSYLISVGGGSRRWSEFTRRDHIRRIRKYDEYVAARKARIALERAQSLPLVQKKYNLVFSTT